MWCQPDIILVDLSPGMPHLLQGGRPARDDPCGGPGRRVTAAHATVLCSPERGAAVIDSFLGQGQTGGSSRQPSGDAGDLRRNVRSI